MSISKIVKLFQQEFETNRILDEYPDATFVIINNDMYLLDDFDHPGGYCIITAINGRQINTMFYGAHASAVSPLRHTHSKYVWKYLNDRYIATLHAEKLILTEHPQPEWLISDIVYYNELSSVFKFSCKFATFANSFKQISSLGKYFLIETSGDDTVDVIKRPYSMVMCMTDDNFRHRKLLKQIYKDRDTLTSVPTLEQSIDSATIPFLIKLEHEGEFTNYLHNFSHRNFKIHGPYGRGLELTDGSRGYYVLIAAGTGVLPFLDFCEFMLKKIIYKILVTKFGYEHIQQMNPMQYNYELMDELKIKFVGCFKSKESFYGASIVTDLYFLNQAHNFDYFDAELRYSNGEQQPGFKMIHNHIDSQYVKQLVDGLPDRIYICGPASMTASVSALLENQNYERKKIFIL